MATATKARKQTRKPTPIPVFPSFWDTDGIATVARLLDNFLQTDGITQNDLAVKIGVSSTTLGNFRKNANGSFNKPEPTTLIRIAPYLINPDTRLPFTGAEIIAFCSGAQNAETFLDYVEITQKRRGQTLASLAKACEVSLDRLKEVLEQPDTLSGQEQLMWLVVLGGKLGNLPRIAKFMGITPSVCAG